MGTQCLTFAFWHITHGFPCTEPRFSCWCEPDGQRIWSAGKDDPILAKLIGMFQEFLIHVWIFAYFLTGADSSTGFMVNFLSLNEMLLISLHGKPSLGVSLESRNSSISFKEQMLLLFTAGGTCIKLTCWSFHRHLIPRNPLREAALFLSCFWWWNSWCQTSPSLAPPSWTPSCHFVWNKEVRYTERLLIVRRYHWCVKYKARSICMTQGIRIVGLNIDCLEHYIRCHWW